jgi:hypothetical protein
MRKQTNNFINSHWIIEALQLSEFLELLIFIAGFVKCGWKCRCLLLDKLSGSSYSCCADKFHAVQLKVLHRVYFSNNEKFGLIKVASNCMKSSWLI